MKKTLLISLATLVPLCIATVVHAQGYTPIAGIPGVDVNELSTEGYVTALYKLSITVACLLALYKIVLGGVKWALSDVVTDKGEAKKDIKGALLGLLIVLSAVLVLNTINPNLTQLNIFRDAPSIDAIKEAESKADVPFGTTVEFNDEEGLANLKRNCEGTIVKSGGGYSGTIVGCYKSGDIEAIPGEAFDPSIYPPSYPASINESKFELSCKAKGGIYNYNYVYASTCDKNTSGISNTNIKIGDTVDLSEIPFSQVETEVRYYNTNCPGENGSFDSQTRIYSCQ